MSDLTPFTGDRLPVVPNPAEFVFKPDLPDRNTPEGAAWWAAYGKRQGIIDEVLANGGGRELGELLAVMDREDPVGVTLNNFHNVTLQGNIPRGLEAPLTILTRSAVRTALAGINFRGGVATRTDFTHQDLRGAIFTEAVVPEADFRGANLQGATFVNAVVNGARFAGAKLRGADFTGAYLADVEDLEDEQIAGMELSSVRIPYQADKEPTAIETVLSSRFGKASASDVGKLVIPVPVALYEDFGPPEGILKSYRLIRGLYARNLNLNNGELVKSILTGATIDGLLASQATFAGGALGGSRISRAVMREAELINTWAPGVVLRGVDLRGANLTGANLVGAYFEGVDLRGTVGFEKAHIDGIVLGDDCRLPNGIGHDGVNFELPRSEAEQKELPAKSD
jgi:uncharacterized protein YjbI with pentapeptide repeats